MDSAICAIYAKCEVLSMCLDCPRLKTVERDLADLVDHNKNSFYWTDRQSKLGLKRGFPSQADQKAQGAYQYTYSNKEKSAKSTWSAVVGLLSSFRLT